MAADQPVIGITCGDPAGVGTEILLKCLPQLAGSAQPVIFADLKRLRRESQQLNLPLPKFPIVTQLKHREDNPVIVDLSIEGAAEIPYGQVSTEGGRAAVAAVERASAAANAGLLDAIVTLPFSKAGLAMAGSPFPGHTEMLQKLSGAGEVVMAFVSGSFRVALLTTHIPISEVTVAVTKDNLTAKLVLVAQTLKRDFAIRQPHIGVLGLNPHAGEDGLLGTTETEVIIPTLTALRQRGCQLTGPLVPDVAFRRAADFDLLFSLYHDQGLIPFKLQAFDTGVNVTFGLPFIRTSVDHGTAYDIAGQGKADTTSFLAAWDLAQSMGLLRTQAQMR